jgi:hypothetical protein
MTTSLIDAESLLVIDAGTVHTRAMLFDVVDGRYRFLASGTANSTAGAPFHDVGEGMRRAIDELQEVTGRRLIDQNEQLIIPPSGDGSGVDTFAVTLSAGAPIKIVAVGLLEDVSLESAKRLARTTYTGVLETISLNDRRKPEERIDTILRLRPDLIVVAGGTEGGASQSVLQLIESVGLACYLMPEDQRPEIVFAGNTDLHDEVGKTLESLASVHFAPNVRPTLEHEQLDGPQVELSRIFSSIRARQITGVRELAEWAGGNLLPNAASFGRVIRFLSKAYTSSKGVMGVDVGAAATTIAAAFDGELVLGVYPEFGLGEGMLNLLDHLPLADIKRWLPVGISDAYVREYLANKSLFPATIPVTAEDVALEEALAREVMRHALQKTAGGFQSHIGYAGSGLLPLMEPIIATGSVLTQPPSLAHSMLMLLDGLQPTGVTTLVLDQNHIAPALGVAAASNPLLSVQVLDSNTFLYLGTVISPVGNSRPGTPILRVRMVYESGHETNLDIKQGALEVLSLPLGQTAQLHLQPLHRYDVGMGGPGRSGRLGVHGGALGVVIDARGRPLQTPQDPDRRQELFKKWLWTLGG